MGTEIENMEDHSNLKLDIFEREKQEHFAAATLTLETLNRLNISIEALPQRCQLLLHTKAEKEAAMDINQFDSISIAHIQTKEISEQLKEEYEVLELRQKNIELQRQINRYNKFIEDLKKELKSSKDSLAGQSPNPENVEEHVRLTKQKLSSYEELYDKAKVKYSKLQVPAGVLPGALSELAARLAALRGEEAELRQRSEDITLAREARHTLYMLSRRDN